MRHLALVLFLVGCSSAAADSGNPKVRICDKANAAQCAAVDATGKVSIGGVISASTTAHATAAAPAYVEGTDNPLSVDLTGNLRTAGGAAATSTAINDGTITTQKLAVDAAGKIGLNNFPASQAVTGTFFQATQPVSAASLPLPSGAATSAAQTDGTQKAIARGGAKGVTTAADVTSTANGVDHQGLDVQVQNASIPVTGTFFQATQPVSGTATANQGTAAALASAWPVKPTDGTTAITVKAASTASVATDTSEVVQISPSQPQLTTPLNVQGGKTNNNAAPGATNFGTLPFLANAGVPLWTEGNQVAGSVDLAGAARVVGRPPVVTGAYRIHVTTAQYAGLLAGDTLISFRYTGTGLCVVTRVRVFVTTQTAATAAGRIDRGLFIVRSFTVADSGGTAITLTSPVGKLRTSYAATGLGNLMVLSGGALTKGTGTQDANPVAIMAKAGTATEPIGLTLPAPGMDTDLFAYNVGQNLPIQLVQNEGLRVNIVTAMPATLANITAATFEYYEVAAAANF